MNELEITITKELDDYTVNVELSKSFKKMLDATDFANNLSFTLERIGNDYESD